MLVDVSGVGRRMSKTRDCNRVGLKYPKFATRSISHVGMNGFALPHLSSDESSDGECGDVGEYNSINVSGIKIPSPHVS